MARKSTSKLFQSEVPEEMKEDAMNLPTETEEKVAEEEDTTEEESDTENHAKPFNEDNVQDIDLSVTAKKKFRINGDKNRILELNTSDLGISTRLSVAYDRLTKYMDKVGNILSSIPEDADEITDEQEEAVTHELEMIDKKMKEELDYIFDAPVSRVCCDGGSMYDPFEGMFRFEHIIDALSKLYENNLNAEFAKMKKRVNTKTSKYTKKYHR